MNLRAVQISADGFGNFFGRCRFRCGNVAEYQLGQLLSLPVPPNLHNICNTLVNFGVCFIWQQRVDDSLVKAQFSAIRGDFEHIIGGRVY